ncbi:chemotaxis protein histidine kinase CheA [Crossiella equi]|uniref:Chemotaxis protein histidine kinase CheA n=1 Tax=Crossiella equi TaxID=130796 RepID=A0ABS5A9P7_9PSEU|nr:DUF6319 family protein [Crossiella equi]MBP2472997.1 chemotaxis protein histidine kinase CheA [Crossiella equi]
MPQALSEPDLEFVRGELTEGRLPIVWFTSSAVGVEEGRSGKVLALGDESEGDFIQVRPTGSMDVLSFSPSEITITKPSRKRAASPTEEVPVTTAEAESTNSAPATPASAEPSAQPATPADTAPTTPAATEAPAAPAEKPAEKPKPAKPAAKKPAATGAAELTVTLTATADGEWSVEVVSGKKKVKPAAVAAANVANLAKELPEEAAEAVQAVIDAARERHRQRVEQLQAELEAAKQALEELAG